VKDTHLTLLVEEFHQMVRAVEEPHRFPALELLFSRGSPAQVPAESANHLRFALFGIEPEDRLPVAALTHVSDQKKTPLADHYWLRSDPVTLWADMAQVFMTSHGFADLNPYERNEIENCIRTVLMEEGIDLHSNHPERWCIALNKPLEFEFTSLDDALGMDLADALPAHPQAGYWRRILNEIQVALHNCPVNIKRRQSGRQEINSVWFWGGGFLPDAAPHDLIDTVYSNNPVTRGLAIINDCRLKGLRLAGQGEYSRDGQSILIDWTAVSQYAVEELELLEGLTRQLIKLADQDRLVLHVYAGDGEGRIYNRRSHRRFWKRRAHLSRWAALRT
jgi:hypothetical protein